MHLNGHCSPHFHLPSCWLKVSLGCVDGSAADCLAFAQGATLQDDLGALDIGSKGSADSVLGHIHLCN